MGKTEYPKNVEKIVQSAKKRTENTRKKAIDAINAMIANGDNITFYNVNKKTGISKTFLYKDEIVSNLINENRTEKVKKIQKDDSKDVIIKTQKRLIKELEEEIKHLKGSQDYKAKYEETLAELNEVKKQLRKAYRY